MATSANLAKAVNWSSGPTMNEPPTRKDTVWRETMLTMPTGEQATTASMPKETLICRQTINQLITAARELLMSRAVFHAVVFGIVILTSTVSDILEHNVPKTTVARES